MIIKIILSDVIHSPVRCANKGIPSLQSLHIFGRYSKVRWKELKHIKRSLHFKGFQDNSNYFLSHHYCNSLITSKNTKRPMSGPMMFRNIMKTTFMNLLSPNGYIQTCTNNLFGTHLREPGNCIEAGKGDRILAVLLPLIPPSVMFCSGLIISFPPFLAFFLSSTLTYQHKGTWRILHRNSTASSPDPLSGM